MENVQYALKQFVDACMYTYTHPSIHPFVMATIRCGTSHKDTKHTDKCSNNKTKTTKIQNNESTDKYFFKILLR